MMQARSAIGAFALGNLLPAVTCVYFYDNAKLVNGCGNSGLALLVKIYGLQARNKNAKLLMVELFA